ncbi:F-box domain containing protein [Pandoravirus neocaledonia]|uniref:F-box domain containing protein n=1 Tax=Pandoravirus neocaledonia TaxID=2107708 RepID=A0A2U7UDU9_9VIRU|nr:F-box domain containing protein [Pandoravirus neocaledonia]AVK76649.1 F-box domain containing protein [Pandoravirus neocaledonia]
MDDGRRHKRPFSCKGDSAREDRLRARLAMPSGDIASVQEAPEKTSTLLGDLPDEILAHVAGHLPLVAVAALGRTSRQMRDICLDDRLWRRFYARDFPPCSEGDKGCLWHMSTAVGEFDLPAYAKSRLDRLLDPGVRESPLVHVANEDPAADRTQSILDALIGCGVCEMCPHHWRSVIAAKGYRWAYASNAVPPRTFAAYPDLPPCLVGRIPLTGRPLTGDYRGDVERVPSFFGSEWQQYRPQGLGTAVYRFDGVESRLNGNMLRRCVSGEWRDGHMHGHAVSWSGRGLCTDPRPPEDRSCRYVEGDYHYFEGQHVDGRPCGRGALIGAGVIRLGVWSADGTCVGQSWRITGADIKRVISNGVDRLSGIGTTGSSALSGRETGPGLVRTGDGIVAFCGNLGDGRPTKGQAFDLSGSLIYDGEFGCDGIDGKGTLYLANGGVMKSDTWKQTYYAMTYTDTNEAIPCLYGTITYPNGDKVKCQWIESAYEYGGMPSPVVYGFRYSRHDAAADVAGLCLSSALGWQVVVPGRHELDPAARDADGDPPPTTSAALERTHLSALCSGHLGRRRWIADFVFWPQVYPRGFDYPDADDAIQFVEHMTSRHPEWAPYRSAIYAFYGLQPPPPTSLHL